MTERCPSNSVLIAVTDSAQFLLIAFTDSAQMLCNAVTDSAQILLIAVTDSAQFSLNAIPYTYRVQRDSANSRSWFSLIFCGQFASQINSVCEFYAGSRANNSDPDSSGLAKMVRCNTGGKCREN